MTSKKKGNRPIATASKNRTFLHLMCVSIVHVFELILKTKETYDNNKQTKCVNKQLQQSVTSYNKRPQFYFISKSCTYCASALYRPE